MSLLLFLRSPTYSVTILLSFVLENSCCNLHFSVSEITCISFKQKQLSSFFSRNILHLLTQKQLESFFSRNIQHLFRLSLLAETTCLCWKQKQLASFFSINNLHVVKQKQLRLSLAETTCICLKQKHLSSCFSRNNLHVFETETVASFFSKYNLH